MNPFTRVNSHLSDAINSLTDVDDDVTDKRLLDYASRLEVAIDAAMKIANEASEYAEMDHEQAALDHYWDQRIDEARGK